MPCRLRVVTEVNQLIKGHTAITCLSLTSTEIKQTTKNPKKDGIIWKFHFYLPLIGLTSFTQVSAPQPQHLPTDNLGSIHRQTFYRITSYRRTVSRITSCKTPI